MTQQQSNENAAIIEAMKELYEITELLVDDAGAPRVVAVPKGFELKSLKSLSDEYRERPERKAGVATLTTLDTFNAYVNRHRQQGSVVFCDDTQRQRPSLVAIFDAHAQNDHESSAVGSPDWQKFRAIYSLPMSDEWTAWTAGLREPSGKPKEFSQIEFAKFLEDRITDVLLPDDAGTIATEFARSISTHLATPAQLMDLARGLTVHVNSKAQQSINATTGETTLIFTEEHKDVQGQPLKVPGAFAIGIPVFRSGTRYPMPVRLRLRLARDEGNAPYWSLAVQRTDVVLEAALAAVVETVANTTSLPVFRGSPG